MRLATPDMPSIYMLARAIIKCLYKGRNHLWGNETLAVLLITNLPGRLDLDCVFNGFSKSMKMCSILVSCWQNYTIRKSVPYRRLYYSVSMKWIVKFCCWSWFIRCFRSYMGNAPWAFCVFGIKTFLPKDVYSITVYKTRIIC